MQESLFYETWDDAGRAIVERAGGYKVVGHRLRPTKSPEQAGRWLADCLNPLRQERLDPEDLMALICIGREIGFHGAKHFFDGETGYVPTPPADPADEQAKLVHTIEQAGAVLQRALTALDKLRKQPLAKVA